MFSNCLPFELFSRLNLACQPSKSNPRMVCVVLWWGAIRRALREVVESGRNIDAVVVTAFEGLERRLSFRNRQI